MALSRKETRIIAQIAKRYGDIIDLSKSPSVMIEILRDFGRRPNGGTGTGGVSTVSTVAVGVTPPPAVGTRLDLADVMKGILKLQREVDVISKAVATTARSKRK